MSYLRCISLRGLTAIHAIRIAPSSLAALHIQRRLPSSQWQARQFSSSPKRQATAQEPEVFTAAFKSTELFREIAEKPEVLQATKDLMQVLQEEGVSLDPSNPPSAMKLLLNSRIRKQLLHTVSVLKENGISAERLQDAYKSIHSPNKTESS